MADMHTPLLPCPFCGGEADLMDTLPSGQLWYRCEECGGETEGGKTQVEAIAAWNRRSPSQDAETIKALREAGQALVDRWDTPNWKDAPATGAFIERLRATLAGSAS